ncbi:hypothetical protein [uncultured Prevotella sp.]
MMMWQIHILLVLAAVIILYKTDSILE